MNISKIEKRYAYLKIEEFEFPEIIYKPSDYFKNELEFMAFFILNNWFYRKCGFESIIRNLYTPDITAKILESSLTLDIEVEYNATNFIMHRHISNFINLIFAFIRPSNIITIKSIPVWSIYKYDKTGKYIYTLSDDINYSFDK